VRFSAAVAAHRRDCPFCGRPLVFGQSAAEVLGHHLYYELRPDPKPMGSDERRA